MEKRPAFLPNQIGSAHLFPKGKLERKPVRNEALFPPFAFQNHHGISTQRKVEARNFDIRKQLLEYDDVANDQRKTIYALRNELLESQDVSPRIADLRAGRDRRPVPHIRAARRASRSNGT